MGITQQQFEQLKSRTSGKSRVPSGVLGDSSSPSRRSHQVILGIDPSLRGTGYGIIQLEKRQPQLIASLELTTTER